MLAEDTEISLERYCIINHFWPVFGFLILFHMHCRMIGGEKHKAKPKRKKKCMAVKRSHMGILFFSPLFFPHLCQGFPFH